MLSANDLINIFLPVLSHWIVWLIFLAVVILVLLLYAYPYTKKPWKEFKSHHIGIPIASVISLYIFTKMLEGVIYQESILKVDVWFSETMLDLHSPWLTNISFFITSFGTGVLMVILVIVTLLALLLRKRWRYALLSLVAILGATLLQIIIKNLANRARPLNSLEVISPGIFAAGFPSGHAITAIVFVSLLIYSFKDDFKNKIVKYVLITIAAVFFISVGLTRIYLNAHWFSDVMGGFSLGLFWFMLVVLVERAIPGVVPAIKVETKEAKSIVPKEVTKTAKLLVPAENKK